MTVVPLIKECWLLFVRLTRLTFFLIFEAIGFSQNLLITLALQSSESLKTVFWTMHRFDFTVRKLSITVRPQHRGLTVRLERSPLYLVDWKLPTWMISVRQFPPGKFPHRKIPSQDNTHPDNPHPENPHPDYSNQENSV